MIAGCAIACASVAAHAQPEGTIAIEYIAPPSCPDEISLRAGIIARLGRDPFFGDSQRKAFIDVQQTAAGFVAAIDLRVPNNAPARRAVGPTAKCEDAIAALELALAVIIDPMHGLPRPQPQPQPQPYYPYRATYEPPGWRGLPPPNRPPPVPTKELAFGLGGTAGGGPDVGFAMVLRAAYLPPGYRIGVVARLAQNNSTSSRSDLTINVRQTQLLAEGCIRRSFLLACGGVGIGIKDVGIGDYSLEEPDRGTDYSDPFLLLAASIGLDIPLGRAFFRPTVELGLPLPAIEVASLGVERYEVSPVQLAFDLALGYRW